MINDTLPLETFEVTRLGGTPFHGFAIQAHAMLLSEGLCDPSEALFHGNNSAIVARIHGEAIGIVVFSMRHITRISLAYVLPDYRRRGVFRRMLDEVGIVTQREGLTRITASASVGNVAFNKAAVGCGLKVVDQVYAIEL